MIYYPFITALLMFGFGVSALWLNVKRPTNQVLAAISFISVLVFTAQLIAKQQGALYLKEGASNPLPWIRLKFSLIAVISPFLVWLCFYLVSGRYESRRDLVVKMVPWFALSVFLFFMPFTQGFKPDDSLPGNVRYGPLYLLYFLPMLVGQVAMCVSTIAVARRLVGVRKLEFTFIAIALGYLSLAAVIVETVYATWPTMPGISELTRSLSFLVYIVFGVSSWSVTSHRIYHSGEVMLSIVQRMCVIAIVALPTVAALKWVEQLERGALAAATVVAGALLLFHYLDEKLRRALRLHPEQQARRVRLEIVRISKTCDDPEVFLRDCERCMVEWAKAERVFIAVLARDHYERSPIRFSLQELRAASVFAEGWMTSVSLTRVRMNASDRGLHQIITQERLGVVVAAGWGEGSSPVLLAIGERETELPYTFPEIRLFQELTHEIGTAYTRLRLTLQARQAEQLALIGRAGASFAHEMRSPMWTLRTFAATLGAKCDDKDYLRVFSDIIPRETERVNALVEQLLHMARPRMYRFSVVDMHGLLNEAAKVFDTKARQAGTDLTLELEAAQYNVQGDFDALRQVINNLLENALQALVLEIGPPLPRVTVRTRNSVSLLVLEVDDNGPGIPKEITHELFTPFATARKKGGLGLGLSICAEIVSVHGGTIATRGKASAGACFHVELPLLPFN